MDMTWPSSTAACSARATTRYQGTHTGATEMEPWYRVDICRYATSSQYRHRSAISAWTPKKIGEAWATFGGSHSCDGIFLHNQSNVSMMRHQPCRPPPRIHATTTHHVFIDHRPRLGPCPRDHPQWILATPCQIGGPSKMTFGTSNLLLFFLAEGCMIIKGVLDSTDPWLHNGLIIIKKS
jgi:hypothetical protein